MVDHILSVLIGVRPYPKPPIKDVVCHLGEIAPSRLEVACQRVHQGRNGRSRGIRGGDYYAKYKRQLGNYDIYSNVTFN